MERERRKFDMICDDDCSPRGALTFAILYSLTLAFAVAIAFAFSSSSENAGSKSSRP